MTDADAAVPAATAAARDDIAGGRFLLGNLRCEVRSLDPRYAAMLASAYGTRLLEADGGRGEPADLAFTIREAARAGEPLGDRLRVTTSGAGTVLASDPMTWNVRADARTFRVDVAVHDPGMRDDLLTYHFWILLNRTLLWLERVTLHAAAIAYRGSVSLFAGPKGAGKSTIAVALARAGGEILADDHVLGRRAGGRLVVSGCASRVRVTAKTERHFLDGALGPETIDVAGVAKKEFAADRFYASRPHEERAVDRLFLPRVAERFEVRPARPRAALLRLVAETGTMLRFGAHADYAAFLAVLADLVDGVPCYELDLSPRLSDLDALATFLDGER